MKKTYVQFKDLAIGDKFRLKYGSSTYTKDTENVASVSSIRFIAVYKNQECIKL